MRGFTLLEVVIALAIVAIALLAAARAGLVMTDTEFIVRERTLAHWVAQNRWAEHKIASQTPALGTQTGEAHQAGTLFIWREVTEATANPGFRRTEISVTTSREPGYQLARLVGYFAN